MKGRAGSEDVLRECASGRISNYYQVTKGWANHKEKMCLLSTTTIKVCITSLNSHSVRNYSGTRYWRLSRWRI